MSKANRQLHRAQANRQIQRAQQADKLAEKNFPTVVRQRSIEEGSQGGQLRVRSDAFAELVSLRQRMRDTDLAVAFWVHEARAAGVTWALIGSALEISQQAACKRFGGPVKGVQGAGAPGAYRSL